jgi:glutathionyl-hydroquinone reductase
MGYVSTFSASTLARKFFDTNNQIAHRTMIVRKLKGLEDFIAVTSVHWHLEGKGWRFATKDENLPGDDVGPDPLHADFTHLREIYFESEKDYSGRFTVPTLYDTKTKRIVNNESADIIRMLNTGFNGILPEQYAKVDLVPKSLEAKIDENNAWIYDDINNGVYKSGFATTQEAYERNVLILFKSLDRVEEHLSKSGPYFFGDKITETDVRLFTTIIRFDPVYVQHFKTNLRDIRSGYPAIHAWLRKLYWTQPAFKDTTQFEHIKKHYTKSHQQINPYVSNVYFHVGNILTDDRASHLLVLYQIFYLQMKKSQQ